MRKVLPMGNPIMDSYPSYGGGFSILDACTKEHLPWVYNSFVQVAGSNKRGQENLISYVGPDIFLCPMLDVTYLNRNLRLWEWIQMTNLYKGAGERIYLTRCVL